MEDFQLAWSSPSKNGFAWFPPRTRGTNDQGDQLQQEGRLKNAAFGRTHRTRNVPSKIVVSDIHANDAARLSDGLNGGVMNNDY
ncbi:hypothetical protein [Zavarzinella formosa]|uniref:hypothetical protein n=1 Tax=Zavarzinella formosa TaxID=360055 RepID=UPI0003028322|nr:hypothetical protein [Zavarzinella formosa]